MHVTLLAVGSIKTSWIKEGCAQYLGRMQIDVFEVPASKQKDPTKQSAEESDAIIKKLEKSEGHVWVLDERGKAMTSIQFSETISACVDRGEKIFFIIGGAYGLTPAVMERADKVIRLSDMTLPHEFCRVVFLEQLYRALQIAKGSHYHH